jgi:hypothetical protein
MTLIQILAGIGMGAACLVIAFVALRKQQSVAVDIALMTLGLWVLFTLYLVADNRLTAANVIGVIIGSPVLAGAFAFRWWLRNVWTPFGRRPEGPSPEELDAILREDEARPDGL